MQVEDIVRPRHVIGVAGRRRDVAVEALTQVRNRQRPGAKRCIELEQRHYVFRRVRGHGAFVIAVYQPVGIGGLLALPMGRSGP